MTNSQKTNMPLENIRRSVIILIILALLFTLLYCIPKQNFSSEGVSVSGGMAPNIQEILNQQAEGTGVTISINSCISTGTPHGPANLFIVNSESNSEPWKVDIYRNDTGELIFESDIITPGDSVEFANLQASLEAGVHPCTAVFHILTPDGTDKSVINVSVTVSMLA